MAGMEDGVPVPVLHTEQIHGCLQALGAPEPEGLPRAVALGMLLMLVEASAASADRFDQEQMYEGYTQSPLVKNQSWSPAFVVRDRPEAVDGVRTAHTTYSSGPASQRSPACRTHHDLRDVLEADVQQVHHHWRRH